MKSLRYSKLWDDTENMVAETFHGTSSVGKGTIDLNFRYKCRLKSQLVTKDIKGYLRLELQKFLAKGSCKAQNDSPCVDYVPTV